MKFNISKLDIFQAQRVRTELEPYRIVLISSRPNILGESIIDHGKSIGQILLEDSMQSDIVLDVDETLLTTAFVSDELVELLLRKEADLSPLHGIIGELKKYTKENLKEALENYPYKQFLHITGKHPIGYPMLIIIRPGLDKFLNTLKGIGDPIREVFAFTANISEYAKELIGIIKEKTGVEIPLIGGSYQPPEGAGAMFDDHFHLASVKIQRLGWSDMKSSKLFWVDSYKFTGDLNDTRLYEAVNDILETIKTIQNFKKMQQTQQVHKIDQTGSLA